MPYARRMPAEIAVLEVIAEPTRRRILDAVRDGERSVSELVEQVGMHQPGVSRHLKVLRDAGLVEVRRDAQRRMYRLRPEPLMELDAWLEPYRAEWTGAARFARAAPATHRHTDPPECKGTPMSDLPASPTTARWSAPPMAASSDSNATSPIRSAMSGTPSPNPARLADWWLPFDADITVDLREGGQMVFAGTGDEPVAMTCTILRVEPPMLLEHTHADRRLVHAVGARAGRHRLRAAAQPLRDRHRRRDRQLLRRRTARARSPGSHRASPAVLSPGTGMASPRRRRTTPASASHPPVDAS